MSFSFKDVQEDVRSGNQIIRPGISEVTIKEIYHQPIGPNVKEGAKPETVSIEKGVFVLVTDEGASFNYDILNPKDKEQAEKMMKRLLHFLSKTSKSADVESLRTKIQSIEAKDLEELFGILSKKFIGKKLRMKFVAKDGKYTSVPNFFSGWAETIDTTPSTLSFDASKEGLSEKDNSSVEPAKKDSSGDLLWN